MAPESVVIRAPHHLYKPPPQEGPTKLTPRIPNSLSLKGFHLSTIRNSWVLSDVFLVVYSDFVVIPGDFLVIYGDLD